MLSEVHQTEKDKYHMSSFVCASGNIGTRGNSVEWWLWEVRDGRNGEVVVRVKHLVHYEFRPSPAPLLPSSAVCKRVVLAGGAVMVSQTQTCRREPACQYAVRKQPCDHGSRLPAQLTLVEKREKKHLGSKEAKPMRKESGAHTESHVLCTKLIKQNLLQTRLQPSSNSGMFVLKFCSHDGV